MIITGIWEKKNIIVPKVDYFITYVQYALSNTLSTLKERRFPTNPEGKTKRINSALSKFANRIVRFNPAGDQSEILK